MSVHALTQKIANDLGLAPVETVVSNRIDLWLSAQQIADARLPGLSNNKRKVNEFASAQRWAFKVAPDGSALARTRKGRGGGIEYHIDLLPPAARAKLLTDRAIVDEIVECDSRPEEQSSIWSWFDQQSDDVKANARRRLAIVDAFEVCLSSGHNRTAAQAVIAGQYGISTATLRNYLRDIRGVDVSDRLAHLAPRFRGGGKTVDVDHGQWIALISDYLRAEEPTWESCYWRAERRAEAAGVELPCSRTLRRKMEREVDPLVVIKRREGREALNRSMPAQIRSVKELHALQMVNIDGHLWDVKVRWPDGSEGRPMMIAIQDVMSRKMLAWRFDKSENAVTTRLAFRDLFERYGIPKECLMDNSRAFASKPITGGTESRYRFQIQDNEPLGILPALGVKVKFATPYHGQAKPIERFFKEVAHAVANGPEFAGAYTGPNTTKKPHNYGARVIDLDVFMAIASREIHALNAKQGRKTEMAKGRSFDDAFEESYKVAPIGKATEEQLRMALLTAAGNIRVHKRDGTVKIAGNFYWSEALSRRAGEQLLIRFDPDNLHSEIHAYTHDGKFIATAPIWAADGFRDMAAAHRLKKRKKDFRNAVKAQEKALDLLEIEELAAMMPDAIEIDAPEPAVVRPVRHRGQTAAALKPNSDASHAPAIGSKEPRKEPVIDRLADIAERRLRAVE